MKEKQKVVANLSGKRSSGESAWESYIVADPFWKDLDIKIVKDIYIRDLEGEPIAEVRKGDTVRLLSQKTIKSGNSTLAAVMINQACGYLTLTSISKPLYDDRVKNKGNVSEGLLAAGITAKFINPEREADINDLYSVLDNLKETGNNELSFTVQKKDATTEQIKLKIFIPNDAMRELLDVSKRKLLRMESTSVLAFVNSNHVTCNCEELAKSGKDDLVEIISNGVGDVHGTKVDLSVRINGRTTNLNISLKAGVTKLIGQVAGHSVEKQDQFWKMFGINAVTESDKLSFATSSPEKWLEHTYETAANKINKMMSCGNKKDFIASLAKGIVHAAVLGDLSVSLVHLSGGSFKVMRFEDMEKKLLDIEWRAIYNNNNAVPYVHIVDSKTGKRLITLKVRKEYRCNTIYYRNYIEKEPLLISLTSVEEK